MSRARVLAAAQTTPVPCDVERNLQQHARLSQIAAQRGAEVLVFPELSLTGYELPRAPELAFSESDERLAPLSAIAAAANMVLIVGAPVSLDARLYIGAFILAPDGSTALHTKRYLGAFAPDDDPGGGLPPPERALFEPGTRSPLVSFDGHVASVGICAESLQRPYAKEAAERGVQSYLTCHFGIARDLEQRLNLLRAFAARYQFAVVFANCGGPSGGLSASGGSAIIAQSGVLLGQLEHRGAGVVVAREDERGWRAQALTL